MRKLIIVLLLCAPAFAGTCGNGYSYSRKFVVPFNLVPNTDQTNFPVTLAFNGAGSFGSIILSDLKTVGNGGKIQNTANNSISVSGPADLIFCDAASAGNTLPFEVAQYSATTGAMEAHILIATLSHTTNNSYWMFYGNVSVVTSQQDLSLWTTAGYSEVCHFPDGSSLNVVCSKSAGTEVNHSATANTGAIGGNATFASASSQYVDLGSPITLSTVTAEAWANIAILNSCARVFSNLPGAGFNGYEIMNGFTNAGACAANGQFAWQVGNGGLLSGSVYPAVAAGAWSHLAISQTGTTIVTYMNGAVASTVHEGNTVSIGTTATNMTLGRFNAGSNFLDGSVDEVRISPSVRSADWIATQFNNQSSPSGFSTMIDPSISGTRIVQYQTCIGLVTNTCVFPQNVVAGNTLLIVSSGGGGQCNGGTTTGFSDTLSSTMTFVASINDLSLGGAASCILRATFPSSGADTLTISQPGGNSQTSIFEIAGMTSVATDVIGGAFGTSTSNSTGSVTATTSNSLLVCGSGVSSSTIVTSFTPATSAALSFNFFNTSNKYGGSAIVQFTGSGAKSCTFGYGTGPVSGSFTIAVLKFSPVVLHKVRSAGMY